MSMHWIMRVCPGAQSPWEQNLRYIERRAPGQNREPVVGCGVPPSYRARTMPCRARLQIKSRREPGDVFHPYHPRAIGRATEAEVRSQGKERRKLVKADGGRDKKLSRGRCGADRGIFVLQARNSPRPNRAPLFFTCGIYVVMWTGYLGTYGVVECGLSFH